MTDKLWRIGEEEIEYIKKAIDSGLHNLWNKKLEEMFAEKFGVNYAIGVNSGTSALHCALFAVGVKPGDEVIVPPLTFGAPAFATLLLGAVPVFADVDPATFTIDPQDVARKISKKTKAIIPVSLYGLPCDIFSIMKIAKKNNDVKVIEDDAQCILGQYNGRIAGTVADMSIFSFQRSKHITSESGGMIATNNEELAEKARKFSILGYATLKARSGQKTVTMEQVQSPDFMRHELVAPNYRLPEICAAMMVAQLGKIEMFVERRQQIAKLFEEGLKGCDWLLPQVTPPNFANSYWTYAIRLDTVKKNISWLDFRHAYLEEGGEPYYAAWAINYLEPALYGKNFPDNNIRYKEGLCPVAESIQPQLIQLKTNYENFEYAKRQSEILKKTVKTFNV